jgi:hypothetical protein
MGILSIAGYIGFRQIGFTNILSKYNHFRASLHGVLDDRNETSGMDWFSSGVFQESAILGMSLGLHIYHNWANITALASWGFSTFMGDKIPLQICFSCNSSNAQFACSSCRERHGKIVAYCGEQCQRADWGRHSKLMHKK